MSWLKLSQLITAALFVIGIMTARTLLLSLGSSTGTALGSDNNRVKGTLIAPQNAQGNFSDLIAQFEQYTKKGKNESVSGSQGDGELTANGESAQEKVDKTLKSNFAAFDESHQIGLVGIFKQEVAFAVLQVINYETKQVENKKLREAEVLMGYEVISIEENSVKLNNGQRELNLVLFKQLNG